MRCTHYRKRSYHESAGGSDERLASRDEFRNTAPAVDAGEWSAATRTRGSVSGATTDRLNRRSDPASLGRISRGAVADQGLVEEMAELCGRIRRLDGASA